jgi:hypothetical protein
MTWYAVELKFCNRQNHEQKLRPHIVDARADALRKPTVTQRAGINTLRYHVPAPHGVSLSSSSSVKSVGARARMGSFVDVVGGNARSNERSGVPSNVLARWFVLFVSNRKSLFMGMLHENFSSDHSSSPHAAHVPVQSQTHATVEQVILWSVYNKHTVHP